MEMDEFKKMIRSILDRVDRELERDSQLVKVDRDRIQTVREDWSKCNKHSNPIEIISAKIDILMSVVIEANENKMNRNEKNIIKKSKMKDEIETIYEKLEKGEHFTQEEFFNVMSKFQKMEEDEN